MSKKIDTKFFSEEELHLIHTGLYLLRKNAMKKGYIAAVNMYNKLMDKIESIIVVKDKDDQPEEEGLIQLLEKIVSPKEKDLS